MKLTFWGLLLGGLVACQVWGIGRALERVDGNWASPWMIAGAVLGACAIALAAGFAIGFRPGPLSDRGYVAALIALIGVKVVVSLGHAAAAGVVRG